MPITRADWRGRVRDRMAIPTTDAFLTNTRVDAAVNQAIQQISIEHDWWWLNTSASLVTVNGTGGYNLPADFLRTIAIVDASIAGVLDKRSFIEVSRSLSAGRPTVYAIGNGQIILRGTPNGVYTLTHYYVKKETPLAADGDLSLIQEPFAEGVESYAAGKLYRAIRESDKALEAFSEYRDWLKRTVDNLNQAKATIRITVRPGSEF